MIIFGILGQGVFQGSLHYHCATPDQYALYLQAKAEGNSHHRRGLDFMDTAFAGDQAQVDTNRYSMRLGLASSTAEDEHGNGSAAAHEEEEGVWYSFESDHDEVDAKTITGKVNRGSNDVPGRALKGGGSTGSTSQQFVYRSPPPPPSPLGVPVVYAAPIFSAPQLQAITCDDPKSFALTGYVDRCCPELLQAHRQRRLREQRRPGRSLKGGGGGSSGPSDPCNPTFDPADGPFCVPGNKDACSAVGPDADCLYFPEAVTLNDFDSVMNAGMVISQIVTLDTWSGSMYDVMAAFPAPSVVWIYYLLAVLIGGFFIINLFLGVVFDEFMRAKATEAAKEELAEKEAAFIEASKREDELQYAKKDGTGGDSPSSVQDGEFHKLEEDGSTPLPTQEGGIKCLKPIVESESFISITLLFLMINVLIMCLPYAGQPESRTELLHTLSSVFTNLFTVEIVLRFLALGSAEFFTDFWNTMDVFLVGVSVLENMLIYLENSAHLFHTGFEFELNVTVFRALRLLRVMRLFRLVQYWKGVYKIFYSLIAAVPQIANIFVLLFVFMTVFALLGMQIFGGACGSEDGSRYHFDYYMPAMLVVLIIFSGGWVDAYESCLPAGVEVTRVYFAAALLIGFFIIMNLFVAILLDSLAEAEEETEDAIAEGEEEGGNEDKDENLMIASEEDTETLHPARAFCRSVINNKRTDSILLVAIGLSSACLAIDSPYVDPNSSLAAQLNVANVIFTILFTFEAAFRLLAYDPLHPTKGYFNTAFNLLDFTIVVISLISLCPEMQQYSILRILRVLRPLRLLSRVPGMSVIFIFLIEASGDVFNVIGVVFFCHTLFAVVGMELFMGAFGACTDPSITLKELCFDPSTVQPAPVQSLPHVAAPLTHRRFLDDQLNMLDRSPPDTTSLKLPPMIQKAPPSAKPLASPEEVESMQMAQDANEDNGVVSEITALQRRMMTAKRQLHERLEEQLDEDESGPTVPRFLRRSRHGRLLKGGGGGGVAADVPTAWLNPAWGSFDDFWSSMLLLLVAATADGWDMFMFTGMDAVGPDLAPVRNDFSINSLFFILWLVLGCFTMMNLFVGSVCDNFSRIKSEQDGSATMTDAQKQWVRTMQESRMFKAKIKEEKAPEPPSNSIQRSFFMIVNSEIFDAFMTLIILLNVCLMAVDFHKMEEDLEFYRVYSLCNQIFLDIYYCECVLKLFGLGIGGYCASKWNQFDFFLVVVSLIDQFATELLAAYLPIPPMLLRTIRVARIMRILRLLKRFKRLRDLIKTTILSFPSLINVGALLSLVTFIYAVLGVQLFCFVRPGDELNDQRNFRTFGSACLLLIQCLTGDGWSTLMADAGQGPERGCDPNKVPTDCGNRDQALPYFLSFMFIGTFVLLNLVVAVILENFSALGNVNPDLVSAADITDFGELWAQSWTERAATQEPVVPSLPASRRDQRSMMSMEEDRIAALVLLQPPPLGVQGKYDEAGAKSFIASLRLQKDEDGLVQFGTVVDALVRVSFDGHSDGFEEPRMPPEEEPDPFADNVTMMPIKPKSPSPPTLPRPPSIQPQTSDEQSHSANRPEEVPPLRMSMPPYYAEPEPRRAAPAPAPVVPPRSTPAPAPATSARQPAPPVATLPPSCATSLPTRQDFMPQHFYAQSADARRGARRIGERSPDHGNLGYAPPVSRRIAVPPPSSVIIERPRRPASGSPPQYVPSPDSPYRRSQRSAGMMPMSPDPNPFRIFSSQVTGGSNANYGGDPRVLPAPARLPPPLGAPPHAQQNGSNEWP